MAVYVNPEGEHPRHSGDIQRLHPSWVEGDDLPEGWLQVVAVSQPLDTYTFEESLVTVTDEDGNEVEVERDIYNSWPLTHTWYEPGIEVADGVATQTWTAEVLDPGPEPDRDE